MNYPLLAMEFVILSVLQVAIIVWDTSALNTEDGVHSVFFPYQPINASQGRFLWYEEKYNRAFVHGSSWHGHGLHRFPSSSIGRESAVAVGSGWWMMNAARIKDLMDAVPNSHSHFIQLGWTCNCDHEVADKFEVSGV